MITKALLAAILAMLAQCSQAQTLYVPEPGYYKLVPADGPVDPPPADCPDEIPRPVAARGSLGTDWQGWSAYSQVGDMPDGVTLRTHIESSNDPALALDSTGRIDCDDCTPGRKWFAYRLIAECGDNSRASKRPRITLTVEEGWQPHPPVDPGPPKNCGSMPPDSGCPCPDGYDGDRWPECTRAPEGDYPEPPHWQPDIPAGHDYSEPGVCTDDHIDVAGEVTLQDGETLEAALDRLIAIIAPGRGGRIRVPYDVDTVQCDTIKLRKRHSDVIGSLALSGIRGPAGEMPRFYCRAEKLDGTIPKGSGKGVFFTAPSKAIIENIEVNGYGKWASPAIAGTFVARNSYFHGATNDGFSNTGLDWEKHGEVAGRVAEFCGNNVSRGGQGNAKHCFYLHRGLPGAESRYTLVDNVIHSCNWSEGFKSTGEYNLISGNRFYKTVPPDEYQPEGVPPLIESPERESNHYGNTLVNIVSCSQSVIRNNLFHIYRPKPSGYASAISVMISGRRGIQGCDRPRGYVGDNKNAVPDYSSEFWNPEYWASIKGHPFTTQIEGNRFELAGPKHADARQNPKGIAVKMYGTYPAIALRQFGPSCLLAAPPQWVERSQARLSSDNIFVGYGWNPRTTRLIDTNPGHAGADEEAPNGTCITDDGCACLNKGYPYPSTAALRSNGKIVEED